MMAGKREVLRQVHPGIFIHAVWAENGHLAIRLCLFLYEFSRRIVMCCAHLVPGAVLVQSVKFCTQ